MFFVVDPDTEVSPQQSAEVWQHLWAMRNLAPVSAMLPAAVSSPCPLLPDEPAGGVLVASLTAVPGDTAWVPLEVDLTRYLGGDGKLRLPLLDTALRAAVEKGERRHDATHWPCSAQYHDSKLNRRLAILVRGWGDVVAHGGADPESLATLRDMQQLAKHVVATLTAVSRAIAGRNGYCPALDVAGARVLQHGKEMNARWRRAVGENAVRHRNLLTLSPWDVFPRQGPADFRYTNLLPLLKCADSVSFRRDVDIGHWNINEFKSFHERTRAILRHSGEAPTIAKQV
jgi:hypothetical protein